MLNSKLGMDFFILDNAEKLLSNIQYGSDFIKKFIFDVQTSYCNSYKCYFLTKEQFDLLKSECYFANQPIDLNQKAKQFLRQIKHKEEAVQIECNKELKRNEKLLKDNKIKKIVYNKTEVCIPTGIHTLDFMDGLQSSLSNNPSSTMFPKKLGLNIDVKPIQLPKKLKFSFDSLTIDNPIFIKNTQLLLDIDFHMFNNMYIYDAKRAAYMKNYIFNELSEYDMTGCKSLLKSVSRVIPFKFLGNMELDLEKVDLLDYLHNQINERLDCIKESILNMDLNQYIKNNIKDYMLSALLHGTDRTNPIISKLEQLYYPFIRLIHPYESKIISNMVDNNLSELIDKLIQSYFKDKDVLDNYTICEELKHFFNVLNNFNLFFDDSLIKFYRFDDFMKKYNGKIARKISEIYPVEKHKDVHFKYSKQFYQDYVADIIKQMM